MAYRTSFFVFSFLFIKLFKAKWLRFLRETLGFAEILNFYIERIPLPWLINLKIKEFWSLVFVKRLAQNWSDNCVPCKNMVIVKWSALTTKKSDCFFSTSYNRNDSSTYFFVSDIRDKDELSLKMKGIDVVYHSAALKHVIIWERSPYQAVQTNIVGVQNVINKAMENRVKHVVFTSSDKAVNPTSVLGTSKMMCERLISAANNSNFDSGQFFLRHASETFFDQMVLWLRFFTTRFLLEYLTLFLSNLKKYYQKSIFWPDRSW